MGHDKTRADRAPASRYSLVVVLAAVCGGMVVDRFRPVAAPILWLVAVVSLILWVWCFRRRWGQLGCAGLLASIAATAAAWHHCCWNLYDIDNLGRFCGPEARPIAFEAVALGPLRRIRDPDPSPLTSLPPLSRFRVIIGVKAVRDGTDWKRAAGRATLIIAEGSATLQAGDRLRAFGQLFAPSRRQNPGEFDFAEYARGDRLLSTIAVQEPAALTVVATGRPWGLRRLVGLARTDADLLLAKYLRSENAGLASALLLGLREHVDAGAIDAFMETGVIHLLAISGMNVAVVAATLFLALRLGWMPRRAALCAVAVTVTFYALLTDAQPPVVRATIMVVLICLGLYARRPGLAMNSLAAAAIIVLALNPPELFRIGPQLSFLSVAVLVAMDVRWLDRGEHDPLVRLIRATRPWYERLARRLLRTAWNMTLVSGAVWLVLAPLVMSQFHLISPIAVILNTLLWIPVGVAILSGFGVLATGWMIPPAAVVLGALCDSSVWCIQATISAAQRIPASHFWVLGPPPWWLVGFYGVLVLWARWPSGTRGRKVTLAALGLWTVAGLVLPYLKSSQTGLRCTALSVGHGCAVMLELPGGQTMLYDAGQLGSPEGGARRIAEFLWSRGITKIDQVVLSHADIDHFNALPELLRRFRIKAVYVSPVMFQGESAALVALAESIKEAGVPIRYCCEGSVLPTNGEAQIWTLHPPAEGVTGSDNANSIVLAVEYAGRRILLPGDLEDEGIEALLQSPPFDCDVLLAPHHGSARSNPPELAAWARPEWVVISGGSHGSVESVESAYQASGAEVRNTHEDGAITVHFWGSSIVVSAFADAESPR